MKDVTVKEMTIEDYDDVDALWRASPGVGLAGADSRPGVAAYLHENPGMSSVARDGDRLVGAVLCGHDGRRGYVSHLAVAAPHRRSGIGRELVERCLTKLADAGIDKCHVFVFSDNEDALEFWRGSGWTERTELVMLSRFTVREE
jgi:ribosomal protein S18 acetylase RimI-like enzyme